jgi:hypothetical protein
MCTRTMYTKVKQDDDDDDNNNDKYKWYNDLEVCVAENVYCVLIGTYIGSNFSD